MNARGHAQSGRKGATLSPALTRVGRRSILHDMENLKRVLRFLGRVALALLVLVILILVTSGQAGGTNKPLGLLLAAMGVYQLLGVAGIVPVVVKVADRRQSTLVAIVPIALGVLMFVS